MTTATLTIALPSDLSGFNLNPGTELRMTRGAVIHTLTVRSSTPRASSGGLALDVEVDVGAQERNNAYDAHGGHDA